jgi:hypothetical protein
MCVLTVAHADRGPLLIIVARCARPAAILLNMYQSGRMAGSGRHGTWHPRSEGRVGRRTADRPGS